MHYHVGDALTSFAQVEGEFDIVYDDIDKDGYPDAWRAARDRVRIGGLYICDNTLWYGRVPPDGEPPDGVTEAIASTTRWSRPTNARHDDPADPRRRAGSHQGHVTLGPADAGTVTLRAVRWTVRLRASPDRELR
jgi:hypothetical protein